MCWWVCAFGCESVVRRVGDRLPVRCFKEGADRAAVLASIREAVAESFPGGSVEVEYEYENLVQGFGLSVPDGSVEVIRGVSGVQSADYVRANRLW